MPTDFTVGSLTVAIDFLSETKDKNIEMILVHGQSSSDSITEMLGFDKDYYLEKNYRTDFLDACQIIRSRFEDRVKEIYADIISSKNNRYIRNYLKGNKVDSVLIPSNFLYASRLKNSFCTVDPLRKNCQTLGIPVVEMASTPVFIDDRSCMDRIDTIFFRKDLKNANY